MPISFKVKKNRKKSQNPRSYTPPPDFKREEGVKDHIKTPQKSSLWTMKVLEEQYGLVITSDIKQAISGVLPRDQSTVFRNKESVRTLHNKPDSGPDPRGRKRVFTREDTRQIARYADGPIEEVSMEDKSAPWQTITEDAGVPLLQTLHKNEYGQFTVWRDVEPQTIARSMKTDENFVTAVAKEEKELRPETTVYRLKFCDRFLGIEGQFEGERPHPKDWRDVVFVDEFHEGIGPQNTLRIKRRIGTRHEKRHIHWKR
ncbi:hypothetical protein EG328_003310 [Venturia inaequalis]|uniref:Uncharacterized protein n=1 Tax=Venturia inaequalis TaxID=5025 RepID=A0A8H3VH51_VENIN|nr:hypothetical protein EG328_003310 [Venturia inaequalis]